MKCVMFTTESIRFRVGEPSNRPKGYVPEPFRAEDGEVHEDVLVVFVCVEEGDDEVQADILATEIIHFAQAVVGRQALLVPFVHLTSHPLKDTELRRRLLGRLESAVQRHGACRGRIAEGHDRALLAAWDTKEHKCGVAFRDSRCVRETGRSS